MRWLRRLGVKHLRTGLSWADSLRPGALEWFDRQMRALEEFAVTVTFCFTPESRGVRPHHTSPPRGRRGVRRFCADMTRRYARGDLQHRKRSSWPMNCSSRSPLLVAGGAGFLGSHLCERLMQRGYAGPVYRQLSSPESCSTSLHLTAEPRLPVASGTMSASPWR